MQINAKNETIINNKTAIVEALYAETSVTYAQITQIFRIIISQLARFHRAERCGTFWHNRFSRARRE